jgi:hypothetical protein
VPASRIGSAVYATAQLKTMQEVITLIVFSGFVIFWLGENLTWNHAIGFALIAIGASLIFRAQTLAFSIDYKLSMSTYRHISYRLASQSAGSLSPHAFLFSPSH